MAAIESLFSAIILILGLSAIANAYHYHHQPENICKRCCGDNEGYLEVPECAAVECACPTTTTTPKPVPICEDCCSDNPTNPRCRFTKCRCPFESTPPPTKKPATCETCCGPLAHTEPICSRVRCDCSPYTTTSTAKPLTGPCGLCCSPEGAGNPQCIGIRCACPARLDDSPVGPCGNCCSPSGATDPACQNNKCACPRQPSS